MRSRLLVLAALATAALVPGVPALAQEGPTIREVDASAFPDVSVTISLPEAIEVSAADVRITESGAEVEVGSVEGLGTTGRTVQVVLAVDVSGSMRGEPLAAAIAAARRFTQGLPETVDVGLLTFADRAIVRQGVTSDHGKVAASLGSLEASGETALHDAVAVAAGMFTGSAQRNVVLLSDGGDTVSRRKLSDAIQAAQGAEATVFSVGLRTPETDVATLRTIAARTSGRYAPAIAADLASVYEGLAAELSSQLVATYRSPAAPGAEASVTVSVLGGTDTALVLMPDVEVAAPDAAPAPQPVPQADPLLRGEWGMWVVAGLTFAAVFLVALVVLAGGVRRRRQRELVRKLSTSKGGIDRAAVEEAHRAGDWVPEPLVAAAERVAAMGGFGAEMDRKLERAGIPLRVGEFLVLSTLAGLAGLVVGALLGNPLLMAALVVAFGIVPYVVVGFRARRRTARLHDQLPDVVMLLASSLRAGHSFLQALDLVSQEIGEPGASEFSRAVAEVRLGRQVDEALEDVADRVGSDDFGWAVLAINIQREVGGNLAEILDSVATTLRERETVRRQVRVLSAEGRISAWILTALPFAIFGYFLLTKPDYIAPLFSTRLGLIILGVGGTLLGLGILWIRRLVKIDV